MVTKSLNKILNVGSIASKFLGNDRFEWQAFEIFLRVAMTDSPVPQAELEKWCGKSQAATSRNVAKLGIGLTIKEPGAGLIETYEDPAFRRRKLVRLTPLGVKLREALANELS